MFLYREVLILSTQGLTAWQFNSLPTSESQCFPPDGFIFCSFILGTTPRGDTGGEPSLACKHEALWIPASQHAPGIPADGLTAGDKPCYLEQESFCTDTLVILMFDNKRSLIKCEMLEWRLFLSRKVFTFLRKIKYVEAAMLTQLGKKKHLDWKGVCVWPHS